MLMDEEDSEKEVVVIHLPSKDSLKRSSSIRATPIFPSRNEVKEEEGEETHDDDAPTDSEWRIESEEEDDDEDLRSPLTPTSLHHPAPTIESFKDETLRESVGSVSSLETLTEFKVALINKEGLNLPVGEEEGLEEREWGRTPTPSLRVQEGLADGGEGVDDRERQEVEDAVLGSFTPEVTEEPEGSVKKLDEGDVKIAKDDEDVVVLAFAPPSPLPTPPPPPISVEELKGELVEGMNEESEGRHAAVLGKDEVGDMPIHPETRTSSSPTTIISSEPASIPAPINTSKSTSSSSLLPKLTINVKQLVPPPPSTSAPPPPPPPAQVPSALDTSASPDQDPTVLPPLPPPPPPTSQQQPYQPQPPPPSPTFFTNLPTPVTTSTTPSSAFPPSTPSIASGQHAQKDSDNADSLSLITTSSSALNRTSSSSTNNANTKHPPAPPTTNPRSSTTTTTRLSSTGPPSRISESLVSGSSYLLHRSESYSSYMPSHPSHHGNNNNSNNEDSSSMFYYRRRSFSFGFDQRDSREGDTISAVLDEFLALNGSERGFGGSSVAGSVAGGQWDVSSRYTGRSFRSVGSRGRGRGRRRRGRGRRRGDGETEEEEDGDEDESRKGFGDDDDDDDDDDDEDGGDDEDEEDEDHEEDGRTHEEEMEEEERTSQRSSVPESPRDVSTEGFSALASILKGSRRFASTMSIASSGTSIRSGSIPRLGSESTAPLHVLPSLRSPSLRDNMPSLSSTHSPILSSPHSASISPSSINPPLVSTASSTVQKERSYIPQPSQSYNAPTSSSSTAPAAEPPQQQQQGASRTPTPPSRLSFSFTRPGPSSTTTAAATTTGASKGGKPLEPPQTSTLYNIFKPLVSGVTEKREERKKEVGVKEEGVGLGLGVLPTATAASIPQVQQQQQVQGGVGMGAGLIEAELPLRQLNDFIPLSDTATLQTLTPLISAWPVVKSGFLLRRDISTSPPLPTTLSTPPSMTPSPSIQSLKSVSSFHSFASTSTAANTQQHHQNQSSTSSSGSKFGRTLASLLRSSSSRKKQRQQQQQQQQQNQGYYEGMDGGERGAGEEDWTLYYVELRGKYLLFYQIANPNLSGTGIGGGVANLSSRSASTSSAASAAMQQQQGTGGSSSSGGLLPAPFYSSVGGSGLSISRPGSPTGVNAAFKGGFSKFLGNFGQKVAQHYAQSKRRPSVASEFRSNNSSSGKDARSGMMNMGMFSPYQHHNHNHNPHGHPHNQGYNSSGYYPPGGIGLSPSASFSSLSSVTSGSGTIIGTQQGGVATSSPGDRSNTPVPVNGNAGHYVSTAPGLDVSRRSSESQSSSRSLLNIGTGGVGPGTHLSVGSSGGIHVTAQDLKNAPKQLVHYIPLHHAVVEVVPASRSNSGLGMPMLPMPNSNNSNNNNNSAFVSIASTSPPPSSVLSSSSSTHTSMSTYLSFTSFHLLLSTHTTTLHHRDHVLLEVVDEGSLDCMAMNELTASSISSFIGRSNAAARSVEMTEWCTVIRGSWKTSKA
ncbi:hypothetical protein HDV05_005890 [Chytridiales sp. JEL 0842]|nr:hypothetical protein HDV05_005890 [Chytridiales sp. JEL 0842]